MTCPLCGPWRPAAGEVAADSATGSLGGAAECELFFGDAAIARADFFHCSRCDLIFKSPDVHLDNDAERARYALHKNDSDSDGYRKFLQPAVDAVLMLDAVPDLGASSDSGRACGLMSGLDYGSGPGPVLSEMLRAHGFAMSVYDPYFANDRAVLASKYDFVTCTEVIEHFYEPAREFAQLFDLIKPGGAIILMTGIHRGREPFKTWRYRIDPTHVCFYSHATLNWVATHFGLTMQISKQAQTVVTLCRARAL